MLSWRQKPVTIIYFCMTQLRAGKSAKKGAHKRVILVSVPTTKMPSLARHKVCYELSGINKMGIWGYFEPVHEIMALFVLRKLILQTRIRSHPVGLNVGFLVGPFVYFHTSYVRTEKAVVRLRRCAGSPEPSLFAYVLSTIISWTGSLR